MRAAQARGVNVVAETCAQYLVLDDSVFDGPDGHLYACCPQLKKPADVARLWEGLKTGEVSVVSTDTCTFSRAQKAMWNGDWTKIPMGMPGLETLLPVVYTYGVLEGRLSLVELAEKLSANPARIMGLAPRKGAIASRRRRRPRRRPPDAPHHGRSGDDGDERRLEPVRGPRPRRIRPHDPLARRGHRRRLPRRRHGRARQVAASHERRHPAGHCGALLGRVVTVAAVCRHIVLIGILVWGAGCRPEEPARRVGGTPSAGTSESGLPSEAASASRDALRAEIERLVAPAGGRVGVAVSVIGSGETIAVAGDERFPMQSVFKLPLAMAALSAIDRGDLRLDAPVRVAVEDLVPAHAHSPIRDTHPGGTVATVAELLRASTSASDGTAADVLLRLVGGPRRVTAFVRTLGVDSLVVASTEKELATDERAQYRSWASPTGALSLLRALHDGRGLSAESRAVLMRMLTESPTGLRRIRAGVPSGVAVAHKTGTSGTHGGRTAATNDIGLVALPDGRALAIAVFVSDSPADEATREAVIAAVARAAYRYAASPRRP